MNIEEAKELLKRSGENENAAGMVVLVSSVAKCSTNAGKSYLNLEVQDATGTLPAKKWDLEDLDEDTFAAGNVVRIERGDLLMYKNAPQLKIVDAVKMSLKDASDYSLFVPSAPVSQAVLEEKLNAYIASIENEYVRKLTDYLVKKFHDTFVTYPAAVRNHHAYVSGVLYHSISMADLAEAICKLPPYQDLDRDILIAGCILHDMGKTIELSGPVSTKFTLEGRLLGHISIMQAEIREAAKELKLDETEEGKEAALLLEHMALSHHTKPEFGSPVPPETKEAVMLGMIDDMDAKKNILDKALAEVEPGEWTQKVFTMDDHYFYKPKFGPKK
jgi:3'-5' exoribonuclease